MDTLPNFPTVASAGPIRSLAGLAKALSLSGEQINAVVDTHDSERYKEKSVPKASGNRLVYAPTLPVRLVQERIKSRILRQLTTWPDYLFGSIPNSTNVDPPFARDYIACAAKHCRSKSILSLDIENFFENIHEDHVVDIFRKVFRYSDEVAEKLANICCRDRALVQGALTSSYLALLSLWDVEWDLVKALRRKELAYTRLVDDITVSSMRTGYRFEDVEYLIRDMLLKKGLSINASKTRIQRAGMSALSVHGLRVNFDKPRLPSEEVRRIRAAVKNVVNMASVNNYRTSNTYRKQFNRTMGRVNKLARIGHEKHQVFIRQLRPVIPLPARRDVEKAHRALDYLESKAAEALHTRRYRRRYHINLYRIAIIKRSFAREAEELRQRMYEVRPTATPPPDAPVALKAEDAVGNKQSIVGDPE